MPTVLKTEGFKFHFFSDEGNEPCHIHVKKGRFWLFPDIEENYYYGFTEQEKRKIRKIIREHYNFLIEQWNEYFKENYQ